MFGIRGRRLSARAERRCHTPLDISLPACLGVAQGEEREARLCAIRPCLVLGDRYRSPGSGLAGWLRLASFPGVFDCFTTYRVAIAQAPYGTFRGPAVSDALLPPSAVRLGFIGAAGLSCLRRRLGFVGGWQFAILTRSYWGYQLLGEAFAEPLSRASSWGS